MNDGRALTEKELEQIRHNIFIGMSNEIEISRLIETIGVQRRVLRELFNLFHREPLKLVSFADPIRNSTLAHFKELVSMEDTKGAPY